MTLFFIIFNFLGVLIGCSVLCTNSGGSFCDLSFGRVRGRCYEY